MLTLFSGLIAGSLHVLSGPDHLAALAPLSVTHPKKSMALGFSWGLGHGLGVVLLGVCGALFQSHLQIDRFSSYAEFIVGFLLIGIGSWTLWTSNHSSRETAHSHPLSSTFGIGWLHGIAGTGHLIGVLPSLALSPNERFLYLGAYLLAAIASMTLFSFALGHFAKEQTAAMLSRLIRGSGWMAISIGVFWLLHSS